MNAIRGISHTLWSSVLVTVAVILGFVIGGALGIPVWLQGFFLLPAVLLFYRLSGEPRPSFWKLLGFAALLSAFVLLLHVGSRFVPERYFWIYYIGIALVFPFGPTARWFEQRFTRRANPGETSRGTDDTSSK